MILLEFWQDLILILMIFLPLIVYFIASYNIVVALILTWILEHIYLTYWIWEEGAKDNENNKGRQNR